MLLRKTGFPEESDIVICTVTKIQFNSVFVRIDEFEKSGMIHISEISPGRIRNIRDYVKEGKRVVCVVLRINRERGHIDLSLRRVNKVQHRMKIEQLKKEQKAEKILEFIAKQNKLDLKKFHSEIMEEISSQYDLIGEFFDDYVAGETTLDLLKKQTKEVVTELGTLVKQRIKIPTVEIGGRFNIQIYDPEGVDKIKKTLLKAEKVDTTHLKMTYLGAGKYEVKVDADDYKTAEAILKKATDIVEKDLRKTDGVVEFIRDSN